jgi:hypothetical protein
MRTDDEPLSAWLAPLPEKSRAAIAEGTANWPPLTDRQREQLRLLFEPRH